MNSIQNVDERYSIQTAIVTNGGFFERQLVKDHTDYLIVRNTSSEKYRTALLWKIITVNEYWISDCLRNSGKIYSLHLYIVLQNPIDYQNYELMSTNSFLDVAAEQSIPVNNDIQSYSENCLSKIMPLDNGISCF